jgi:hypothetical protein
MAGIGEGFGQGLSLGMAARQKKKDREADAARLALEAQQHKDVLDTQKSLRAEDLKQRAEERKADRQFQTERDAAQATTRFAELDKQLASAAAIEAGRNKQRGDEAALNQIGNSIGGFQKFVAATAPKPEYVTIEQPLDPENPNAGKTTRKVPASSFGQMPQPKPAESYQSPYKKEIDDADAQIAENNAALAEGDKHPGWNVFSDRKDTVAEQTQRRVRLQALDIQNQLDKGLISQEEADARADRLKKSAGL